MEFKIMGKKGDAVFDYDAETAEIKPGCLNVQSLMTVRP